jgi:hypothetical protein
MGNVGLSGDQEGNVKSRFFTRAGQGNPERSRGSESPVCLPYTH